jgi:hypothetical protein
VRGAQPAVGRGRPPRPPRPQGPDRLLSGTGPPGSFDPEHLGPEASLNKLVIRPAPAVRPEHVGLTGGDLLGRDAVAELVRRHGGVAVRPGALSDWLAGDAPGAADVVDEMGHRLGSLLATLRAPATAEAAVGARRTYLEVWPRLDHVVVGGGLAKGTVGRRVAAGAEEATGVRVVAARHPEWLPLIGAARSTSRPHGRVLVMDGGQTSIKRGIAELRDGTLAGLVVLAPLPVESLTSSQLPAVVARQVTAMREEHTVDAGEVMFSVASYLEGGRPVRRVRSIYERLDPPAMQSEFGLTVTLLHDGTAAWRAAASDSRSAVVMLGTWLGVGIGPQRAPLRPIAADFTVSGAP